MLDFPSAPTVGQGFSGGGSSWVWDGVKWGASAAPLTPTTVVPVSGATIVMTGRQPLYVNNAAVLASLTIALPASPTPGQLAELGFRSPITAIFITNAAGTAIIGAPNAVYGPGAAVVMCYVDHSIAWTFWK